MPVRLADLANPSDQALIVELLDMYCRDQFGDGKPLSAAARENLIPGLAAHNGARVFLAYEDDQPAGFAICLVGFSSFKGKRLINIHDLAVAPGFRGRGIGRALLAAIDDEARRLDCCKVTLEVRSDNELAWQLYRRFGYRPSEPAETWFWSKPLD
ncbi:MAG: GNAT family N-acetyltransferase [Pirellulaceae bacterium]|nr:GNAT family N-acetyltransferase [Pirellulaceae bacterium]